MTNITFIDTSVLLNLVPVPGRDQHRETIRAALKDKLSTGVQFVLPITAVIETGNFIAQLSDGHLRFTTAKKFDAILQLVSENKAPWILHDVSWDRAFLNHFREGGGSGSTYIQHAQNKVGAGDLCILTERSQFEARTRVQTNVWTLDYGLGTHS